VGTLILCDVNVLVYAHREDAASHVAYREWLFRIVGGSEPFGYSDLVLSGFVRVVTHPRVFARPTPLGTALEFCSVLRSQPNAVSIAPGPRHWEIFERLCESSAVRGNLVPDAYLAALALESGSTWATADRDFVRFRELNIVHPLGEHA
jgi:toxin-antitoxin system PIN domain toxin